MIHLHLYIKEILSVQFQLPLFLSDQQTLSWVGGPWDRKNYFRGSSVEGWETLVLAMGCSLGFSYQFTISGSLPAYYSMRSAGSSPRMQSCQGRKLTTHLHLLLRLRTSGAVFLLPLWALMLCIIKGRMVWSPSTLNPLLPSTLLEHTSKDGSILISEGEDSTRRLHTGSRFMFNVLNLAGR